MVASVVEKLQARVDLMQGRPAAQPVATHPALHGLLGLRAGGTYTVDSATLVGLLLAGPSADGAWCGVVGSTELGLEATAALGVDLGRLVLVPDPADAWLEVTAALVDALGAVVVRPPSNVAESAAARLVARLRKRGGVLVVWGDWPRPDARLTLSDPVWAGLERGHGHLQGRQATVEVRRGTGPARRRRLWLPAPDDQGVREVEAAPTPLRSVG
jgi:hypothetical protein